MRTRRRFIALAAGMALGGCAGSGNQGSGDADGDGGGDDDAATRTCVETTRTGSGMSVSTGAISCGWIDPRYTADGEDVSPPVAVSGVPDGAETLALVVDDPDAPGGTFVHWLLWNVPASTGEIPEGVAQRETVSELVGARQGTNGFGELGYRGPKPPTSDGPHTYRFTVYALDAGLDVPAGAKRDALADAREGHTVARARVTGEYERG